MNLIFKNNITRINYHYTLQDAKGGNTVVIVDEVGKMELFSQSFVNSVRELLSSSQATVLATVPVTKQRPIPFVDELKKREDVQLIEVSIFTEVIIFVRLHIVFNCTILQLRVL